MRATSLLILSFLFASHLQADIYTNETAFQSSLSSNIDYGYWDVAPATQTGVTGYYQAPLMTDGGGNQYRFSFIEGTYDTVSGIAPTIASISTTNNSFSIESPAMQGSGAAADEWGFDTVNPISTSSNTAAILDFRASATDIFSFSFQAVDFEGGAPGARPAYIGAYADDGTLIESHELQFAGPNYGNNTVQFFGLNILDTQSVTGIGYIAVFVGDDTAGGAGTSERIALGTFGAGFAASTAIPEPNSLFFVLAALAAASLRRRKR